MAQFDTSIYQNLLSGVRSPESFQAERQQLKASELTNALNRQKVDEYQAGIKRQGELRNMLMGGADADTLRRGGFLDEATKLETDAVNARKGLAEAGSKEFDLAKQRYDVYRKTAGARFNDPNLSKQSVLGDIAQMQEMGILTPEVAQRLASQLPDDPIELRKAVRQAAASQLTPEQMLTAFAPKPEKFDSGGQIITRDMNPNSQTYGQSTGGAPIVKVQSPESRASVAAQIRGQNMSAETTRRGQDIAASTAVRGQDLVEGRERTKAAGGGNVTEGERKAGTLLSRMRGSLQQLNTALAEDGGAAKPGLMSEALRNVPLVGGDTAANLVTPQSRQRVEAAQLDLLDAALTLGTGAAYTKEQLRGYARSYFPQIGDDSKTVADKKARLDNVISAAEIAAGRAAPAKTGGATGQWGGWSIQEVK